MPAPEGGLVFYYRDATGRRQAEQNRDIATRRLQEIFAATSDAILSIDRNWKMIYLNRRAEELLSPAGNLVGKNLWEIFPDTIYQDSPFVAAYHRVMGATRGDQLRGLLPRSASPVAPDRGPPQRRRHPPLLPRHHRAQAK